MPVSATATVTRTRSVVSSLACTNSPTATMVRQTNKTLSCEVKANRVKHRAYLATVTPVATLITVFSKPLLAVSPPAAYVLKRTGKTVTTSNATTATIVASSALTAAKTLAATVTSVPTLVRQAQKVLKTGMSIPMPPMFISVGPIASLSVGFIYVKTLTATQAQTATVRKLIAYTTACTATATASVSTAIATILKTLTATIGQTAVLTRVQNRVFSNDQGLVPTLTKRPSVTLAATQGQTASVVRVKAKICAATIVTVASILYPRGRSRPTLSPRHPLTLLLTPKPPGILGLEPQE